MSTIIQGAPYISTFIKIRKCNYIANLFWIVAISSTKFSILLLYMRLFTQRRKSRWVIRILFCIVTCWAVIGVGDIVENALNRLLTMSILGFPYNIPVQTYFRLLGIPLHWSFFLPNVKTWLRALSNYACCY